MQVVINMDDEKFDQLFGEEVGKLDPREIKDIFAECVKEYFTQNNYQNVERLITEKESYYGSKPKFTWFGQKLIEHCDYSKLQEVVDKVIDSMVNNHETLLKEMLFEVISVGFTNSYSMQKAFEEKILPLTMRMEGIESNIRRES